jgi:hypothetical protein
MSYNSSIRSTEVIGPRAQTVRYSLFGAGSLEPDFARGLGVVDLEESNSYKIVYSGI